MELSVNQYFGEIIIDSCQHINAMLCIDKDKPNEGVLHCWNSNPLVVIQTLPIAMLVKFEYSNDNNISMVPINFYHINQSLSICQLSHSTTPTNISIYGVYDNDSIKGNWIYENQKGTFSLNSTLVNDKEGNLSIPQLNTWNEFKNWASDHARTRDNIAVFRGQGSNEFSLQTTFHRTGKHRLERYCNEILSELQNHSEAVFNTRIDLSNPQQYATLLGLAQHHGLPTPLLDLTKSPYIAAFFAFSDALENKRQNNKFVRIYGFTRDFIAEYSYLTVSIPYVSPYIATLSISSVGNPRLHVQQGQFIVTNISSLESFIISEQIRLQKTLMIAVDISIDCIAEALTDLQYMGITAATLFPGIDGVCKMLKHQMLRDLISAEN
jgi:hypothetical protein